MNTDDVNTIVQQAKANNQVKMTLEEQCDDFLDIQAQIKNKNAQLRDMRENHVNYPEIKDLQKKLKELRAEIQGDSEFVELKEEIGELKDKRVLSERMIMTLLKEGELMSFDYQHIDFQIEEKFAFKKKKADDENSKMNAQGSAQFDNSDNFRGIQD